MKKLTNMIDFGGTIYYIDMNAFDKAITPVGTKPTDTITSKEIRKTYSGDGSLNLLEEIEVSSLRGKEIDAAKFELIRLMIDVILDYGDDESDTSLGAERALDKTPLSFKLAFNTLINYGIIKEKE
jgi:hypothetical protein